MRTLFTGLLILIIGLFYVMGGSDYLDFEYLKKNLQEIQNLYSTNPFWVLTIFTGAFLFLTSLAIPGSIVLTILSGAIFGTFNGVVIVSMSGTIGATLSFLISRYLLKEHFEEKFHHQFNVLNKNLKRDGTLYLFVLRFIPVSPFVVINLIAGLTNLNIWTFIWTTFLGMIPGNIIYVYAGKKMGEMDSPADIMSPSFILSLTLLGILPLVAQKFLMFRKKKMIHV